MLAAVAVAVVLVVGLAAIVVTRQDRDDGRRRTASTTTAPATVPTPEDVEALREQAWRVELGGGVGRRLGVAGDLVIATAGAGRIVAVDASGDIVWSETQTWSPTDAPLGVVTDGTVLVTRTIGSDLDSLEVRSVDDGALLWEATLPLAGYADHQVVITDDLVIANGFDTVEAWDRLDGTPAWSAAARGDFYGLAAADGAVVTVDQDPIGTAEVVRLDEDDGQELSRAELAVPRVDSRWPIVAGGDAAVGTAEGAEWVSQFQPIDLATGTPGSDEVYEVDLDLQGIPLAVVGDLLILATAETYSILAFSVETGDLRWASSHSGFEVTVEDGRLLARGLDLFELDLDDGGATILAHRLEQYGGPPVRTADDLVVVSDETGLVAYR